MCINMTAKPQKPLTDCPSLVTEVIDLYHRSHSICQYILDYLHKQTGVAVRGSSIEWGLSQTVSTCASFSAITFQILVDIYSYNAV